jgi:RNA polymerase sigma-70 factor (ECF subfamily)
MTDKARIERCLKGEKKAFKEFYELYAKAMFNISLRILDNTEEAEDVLQESFVTAFENMAVISSDAGFGGYLKKIIVNRSIDRLRKKKIDFLSLDEARYAEDVSAEEEPDYNIDRLLACIKELPQGFQLVLTLYLIEDYSHREVGELLHISEGTSKSQYNRARKKLAEIYHQKYFTHA